MFFKNAQRKKADDSKIRLAFLFKQNRMPRGLSIVFLVLVLGTSQGCHVQGVATSVRQSGKIDWRRFDKRVRHGAQMKQCGKLLLNSARYCSQWINKTYKEDPERKMYIVRAANEESVIRPPASAAYALAAVIKTGLFDKEAVGVSKKELTAQAVKLIKGVAAIHIVNRPNAPCWGLRWQSAFWAAQLCGAGWMLWDELDVETRRMIRAVAEREANHFRKPQYRAPYWNGKGGDTKAEENAWNSMIMHIAVAMMPRHPRCPMWKEVGSELMVSAWSLKKDMEDNATVLDGKAVKEWLNGFNVRQDGAVINHNLVHTDYMCCVTLQMRTFITQSLAGQTVSETADFNAAFIYNTLVNHKWPSPPYEKPGGTMYIPGKAEVYYPTGTDWSRYRFDIYYLTDVYAHVFGWDKGFSHSAAEWMRLRGEKLLKMQARHADARVFARGEFDNYFGREQQAAGAFADAYLLLWLRAHHALSKKGNWLVDDVISYSKMNSF